MLVHFPMLMLIKYNIIYKRSTLGIYEPLCYFLPFLVLLFGSIMLTWSYTRWHSRSLTVGLHRCPVVVNTGQ